MEKAVKTKLEAFFSQWKPQSYKKGELLIRANSDPSGIFYLKAGVVKEYAISRKGDELVVNSFKESAFFPMSWAMNNTPNKYFFEAATPLEVYKAPKEKVIEFLKANPDVVYDLLSRVYKGTDGLLVRMMYLMSASAYKRLITELLIYAKRFSKIDETTREYILDISETDLAAQAGMTRETVSREMKLLKEKELVTVRKNELVITDLERLENELSDDF